LKNTVFSVMAYPVCTEFLGLTAPTHGRIARQSWQKKM